MRDGGDLQSSKAADGYHMEVALPDGGQQLKLDSILPISKCRPWPNARASIANVNQFLLSRHAGVV
jgi:hypothetical protein